MKYRKITSTMRQIHEIVRILRRIVVDVCIILCCVHSVVALLSSGG